MGEEWAKEQEAYTIRGIKLDMSTYPKKSPTPRMLLQQIGTDLFRNQLHPNCWINATFANYTKDDAWIITDCRFKNEAKAIRDRGGIVIRINRNNINIEKSIHQSEVDLDDYEFDYIIYNNSDIPALINEVKNMLVYFNLL